MKLDGGEILTVYSAVSSSPSGWGGWGGANIFLGILVGFGGKGKIRAKFAKSAWAEAFLHCAARLS